MTGFTDRHPAALALFFTAVLLPAMFLQNPVIQAISLIGGILFSATLSSKKELLSDLGFYAALFLLTTVTNPLFSHNGKTPLFFINGNAITLEAVLYGADIGIMIVSVIIWFKCFGKVITSEKLTYLFGKAAPKIALTMTLALRFVPSFKKQYKSLCRTQKTLGLFSSKSRTDRIVSNLRVLSVLIGLSLENAIDTSSSMKARGYALQKKTSFSNYNLTAQSVIMIFASVFLLLTTLFFASGGVAAFSFYPALSPVNMTAANIACFLSYALISFLPFIIESEEKAKWKYFVSKI